MFEQVILSMQFTWNISLTYLSTEFFPRCLHIITSPVRNPDMLWMLVPLLATLIFMEFYFGRYKDEELGWNTAYGNALVLAFVSIDLFRNVYEPLQLSVLDAIFSGEIKIWVSIYLLGLACILLFVDFFISFQRKLHILFHLQRILT